MRKIEIETTKQYINTINHQLITHSKNKAYKCRQISTLRIVDGQIIGLFISPK